MLQTVSCRVTLREFIDPVRAWSNAPAETRARRVRGMAIVIGLIISLLSFVAVSIDVLLKQWIEGMASPLFMFGTACLIAAACIVLFSIITFIGFLVSGVLFRKHSSHVRSSRG